MAAMLDDANIVEANKPPKWSTVVLGFWIILLVPWVVIAPLSGMAFDAGYTVEAYTFIWCVLTYPITVLIAGFVRKKKAVLILLPCVNFLALWLVPAITHHA